MSGKQRESDLDNKRTNLPDAVTAVRDRRLERGEWAWGCRASVSWCFLPLFSLMSVRMQVSFFKKKRDGRERRRKTKQQESRKRPKEHAFLIKCLASIYSKFCRLVVEHWCRAQAHKLRGGGVRWGISLIRAAQQEHTQVSLQHSGEHNITFSLFLSVTM